MSEQSYDIVAAHDLSPFLDILKAPGGASTIRLSEGQKQMRVAHFQNGKTPPVFAKRWQRAQQAEAAFWRRWRQNVLYKHISLEAFWQEVLDKTGGSLPSGKILDVGCGPVSVLNFHRHSELQPIGLDPLGSVYARESLLECRKGWLPMPIIALSAEQLPFADASLDHLICYNVLDHVSDAPAVLAEMRRVLKAGGSLRLYVHTFASWIKRFLFFDRPHTYHWDHPEFRLLLERSGFVVRHQLEEPKTFDLPPGLKGRLTHFPYWFATKVAATSYFNVEKAT